MTKVLDLLHKYFFPRLVLDLVTFYPLLMFAGVWATRLSLDLNVWLGIIANYWLISFAFVYNDIVDRADDAKSNYMPLTIWQHLQSNLGFKQNTGGKRFLNPFSHGLLTPFQGYIILALMALAAIVMSFVAGGVVLAFVAAINLIIGLLYSHPVIRLKSRPGLDILSHATLLAALEIIYFIAYPLATRDLVAIGVLAISFAMSVSGDLFNEHRDFKDDQAAGIRNMATILGAEPTIFLAQTLRFLSIAGLVLVLFARY